MAGSLTRNTLARVVTASTVTFQLRIFELAQTLKEALNKVDI